MKQNFQSCYTSFWSKCFILLSRHYNRVLRLVRLSYPFVQIAPLNRGYHFMLRRIFITFYGNRCNTLPQTGFGNVSKRLLLVIFPACCWNQASVLLRWCTRHWFNMNGNVWIYRRSMPTVIETARSLKRTWWHGHGSELICLLSELKLCKFISILLPMS